MLGITFSPQNYHHHQQIPSKLRENNENDMTSAVWAVIVFGHVYGRSQLTVNPLSLIYLVTRDYTVYIYQKLNKHINSWGWLASGGM